GGGGPELGGRDGSGWRGRVAAPPERGRANDALVGLLASVLDVPASSVRVVGGQRGRGKGVEVASLDLGGGEGGGGGRGGVGGRRAPPRGGGAPPRAKVSSTS